MVLVKVTTSPPPWRPSPPGVIGSLWRSLGRKLTLDGPLGRRARGVEPAQPAGGGRHGRGNQPFVPATQPTSVAKTEVGIPKSQLAIAGREKASVIRDEEKPIAGREDQRRRDRGGASWASAIAVRRAALSVPSAKGARFLKAQPARRRLVGRHRQRKWKTGATSLGHRLALLASGEKPDITAPDPQGGWLPPRLHPERSA